MSDRSTTTKTHLGAILTMLAMFGFAAMDSMSKLLVHDYAVAQTLWIRYGIFTIFALLIARRTGVRRAMRSARPVLQASRALLGLVENAVFVLAFYFMPLADAHAITMTSPLIVIALSALLLGERPGRSRWLAVGTGFIGVLVIIRPGIIAISWPILLPIAGAVLWAVYQMLVRLCARYDPPQTTLVWSGWVGFAATTLVGPWQWRWPDAQGWALIVGLAVLGTLSHYALIRALDYATASAIQPYSYFLLVWAVVMGMIVFGDAPDFWTVLGATIVTLSGLYAWRQDIRDRAA